MRSDLSVLFIGDSSRWARAAAAVLDQAFHNVESVFWDYANPKDFDLKAWNGDWILCLKSDLILSPEDLARAKKGAVNIHPAPPEYRGVGGYYYAVDAQDKSFGITCHHITNELDAGPIISVRRFDIHPGEAAECVMQRAGAHCVAALSDVIPMIISNDFPSDPSARWGTKLYTRAGLETYLKCRNQPQLQIA